jgi:hypothetical protein
VLAVVAEAFEVEVFDIQRSCCVARAARQLLSMQFLLLFLFHLSGIFKTNLLCEELSPGKAEYLQTRIRRARARASTDHVRPKHMQHEQSGKHNIKQVMKRKRSIDRDRFKPT